MEAFTMNRKRGFQGSALPVGAPAGRKVAVVGTGFAGLGCADILVQKDYKVTIFESTLAPGRLLVNGIQNFKPSKDVWQEKREEFEHAGVKFVPNIDIGKDKMIDDLFEEGFDAVFIDVGFEMDTKMEETPGTDLSGVYEATDFLFRGNVDPNHLPEDMRKPLEIGRRVVVIGGGDIASDCLRAALRFGSEDVTCLCSCTENEMPDEREIRKVAREEGVKYRFLIQPVKFIAGADGRLAAVECVEMKLGEPDAKGRRNPVPVEGSNFSVAADTAIISKTTPDIETYLKDKNISITSREGVFTGGDYAISQDLIVSAMEGGRKAALAIDEYLKNKK
jgi:glutamate synthase (NADPH/NADH) small chain